MKWSWDSIRYFVAAVEHKTIIDAAKSLDVSHTTVQRRINSLEKELNVALFEKGSKGMQLTKPGEILYQESIGVRLTLDRLVKKVSVVDQQLKGDVSVTSTDTICFFLLPSLVKQLSSLYPELNVSLAMTNKLSDIENMESEIAIRTCETPPLGLIGRPVGKIRFAVCASRQYADTHNIKAFPDKLDQHQLICLSEQYAGLPFADLLRSNTHGTQQVTTVNGLLGAYSLCDAGLGITVLPSYMLEDQNELIELTTDEPIMSHDLWILCRQSLRNVKRIRLVRQFLFTELSKVVEQ